MPEGRLEKFFDHFRHPFSRESPSLEIMHNFRLGYEHGVADDQLAERIANAISQQWNLGLKTKIGLGDPGLKKPLHAQLLSVDEYEAQGEKMIRAHVMFRDLLSDGEGEYTKKRVEVEFSPQ